MLEQDIPIDIHTNKLFDWLQSRRHCSADWQKKALVIREKINNAIQDMPQHPEIANLLSGAYINYFHCKRIVELLKETEADTKNLFGRYGSQRMKDWQEILSLYEKDNVYLAEAANLLIRNVKYEVPNIKKQIAKCNQMKEECDKKENEYTKHEHSAKAELDALMKQLGITGKNIRKELIERIAQLPDIYEKISSNISTMKPAVDYYLAFTAYTIGQEIGSIPLLKYLCEHGNTTTYEYLYGEKPTSIEAPEIKVEEKEDSNEDSIDWGTDEINFTDEIEYGITLEESGIEVEQTPKEESESGVAKGKYAYTLLDNPETRIDFVNQLLEIESFLKLRLLEMQGEAEMIALNQLQETTEGVAAMLDTVSIVKQLITDPGTTHLHNIKHSPRYVDQLTQKVEHKQNLIEKIVASRKAVRDRGLQSVEEARELTPKLQLIIEKTKELQKEIEQEISKKYKNRPVNIMGGVATL
ncbi:CDK5 regulatory subunit-associated protein 3 [Lycorma delicatula]|uniref:CDK5 regulatory subunit-associated protein 3 n=1 Tax=Lycorma delicatula TaxID=130591 RepID=UPI003F516974